MTTTPLPSYGIWTTDMEGKRVMGFTPEQFLSVWQARADLEAENQRLRMSLEWIVGYVEASPKELTEVRRWLEIARAALESKP